MPAAKKAAAPKKAKGAKAAKAEGDAPVQAYIASLPAWQRDLARRFDGIVMREVPKPAKAVKWSAAFYGVPGQGLFVAVKGFSKHLKLTFFRGASLKPAPPSGEHEQGRSLDLREGDTLDEAKVVSWVRQASALPGWGS